jgi:hypothetical protein
VATLTRSNLNADPFGQPYPIVASYSGDASNLSSKSAVLSQHVLQTKTVATLASSANPSTQGQAVTFTAKITSPTAVITGPVTFSVGSSILGTAQLSGGIAKFTTSALPVGSSTVKVTYSGDSNVAGILSSLVQIVARIFWGRQGTRDNGISDQFKRRFCCVSAKMLPHSITSLNCQIIQCHLRSFVMAAPI